MDSSSLIVSAMAKHDCYGSLMEARHTVRTVAGQSSVSVAVPSQEVGGDNTITLPRALFEGIKRRLASSRQPGRVVKIQLMMIKDVER